MKKLIAKVLSAALTCVMICTALSGCSDPLKSTEEEMQTVMTVGGYDVPYEFYRYLVLNYKTRVTKDEDDWNDSEKAAEMEAKISALVENSLRDFYAALSLAKEFDIDRNNAAVDAAVEAELEATRNGYESDEEYIASLAEGYMNHSTYELIQTNAVCSEELYYKMMNDGALNADEDFLRDFIYGDGFIRIKQILVVGESSAKVYDGTVYTPEKSHTDEEAAAIAETVMNKAKAGEDFDELVAEYGESFHMFSNTDGYYICEGYWDDINSDAAFALEIGEISDVIESDKGYSVFLRCEKDEDYIEKHYDELCDIYTESQYSLAVEKRSAELEITKTELYDTISIRDMKWEAEEN